MKKFYFAPLEGITTYTYRNLHYQWFGGMDKYFTPFVSPTSNRDFKSRAKKDVVPEHNKDIPVVPQILSNRSDEFLYTADRLAEYGYPEVDRIMIGRGLIANPGLVREIQTGQKTNFEELLAFTAALQKAYQQQMADSPVLFKMKEIWVYMASMHPQGERLWKKIKKAKRLSEYEAILASC